MTKRTKYIIGGILFVIFFGITFFVARESDFMALTLDEISKMTSSTEKKDGETVTTPEEIKVLRPSYLPKGPEKPTDIIYNVLDYIFFAAGILATIFIILASIRAIASFGNEEAVTEAKKMFIYAVVGLLVIILSYAAITMIIRYLFFQRTAL